MNCITGGLSSGCGALNPIAHLRIVTGETRHSRAKTSSCFGEVRKKFFTACENRSLEIVIGRATTSASRYGGAKSFCFTNVWPTVPNPFQLCARFAERSIGPVSRMMQRGELHVRIIASGVPMPAARGSPDGPNQWFCGAPVVRARIPA